MTNASSQASMVTLALLKLEVEGLTIVHTDKLHEIMSSEQKSSLDEYNIQPLGNNSPPKRHPTNDQQVTKFQGNLESLDT